ncbi:MAG: PQQ-dependent sugar dehydrogenase [Vitreoscilla sp.]|nr:PQQ-dependent sugar dehydrogenase [Vitreoscilla sp.]
MKTWGARQGQGQGPWAACSRVAAGVGLGIVIAACGGSGGGQANESPLQVVTLVSGLDHPWSLAFLPDRRMLVTERPGRLRLVSADGQMVSGPISGVPTVFSQGQGGLFDIALAPDFASSRVVYLSYAEPGSGADAGKNGTAVMRATLNADATALTAGEVIFRQTPKVASTGHFGGRLAFARNGDLFLTLGERLSTAEREKAQDLSQGHGKVMRMRADGSASPDNPFLGVPGTQPTVWSLGHRNPQGAAIHPDTGELWSIEHGPQGGDELNIVQAGRNYGWPRVSYGCEYGAPVGNCTPVGGASTGPGFEPPLTHWVPVSIAPSGMAFYTGSGFPEWRGNLFVGALAGKALWRITLDGHTVVDRQVLLTDLGQRLRDVRQGPDGWLYLLTDDSNGRILRLQR